jgi:signal peptidase I
MARMENPSKVEYRSNVQHRDTQRTLAAFISCVLPGLGHLLLGKRRAAIAFLCALGVLSLLYWPLRLPKSYFGMQVVIFVSVSLFIAAGWHALRTPCPQFMPGSRWWLILLVPLAFKASFWHDTRMLPVIGLRAFDVPSSSMAPTVIPGDRVVADLAYYKESKPKPKDVVIIQRNETFLIKRVVARGGDTVEGKNDLVLVNEHPLNEPYVQHTRDAFLSPKEFGPVEILPGELFVLGDNRDNSIDSRSPEFGSVTEQSVGGKVLYVVRRPKWWRAGVNLIAEAVRPFLQGRELRPF